MKITVKAFFHKHTTHCFYPGTQWVEINCYILERAQGNYLLLFLLVESYKMANLIPKQLSQASKNKTDAKLVNGEVDIISNLLSV